MYTFQEIHIMLFKIIEMRKFEFFKFVPDIFEQIFENEEIDF